jgi:hypothetical protein
MFAVKILLNQIIFHARIYFLKRKQVRLYLAIFWAVYGVVGTGRGRSLLSAGRRSRGHRGRLEGAEAAPGRHLTQVGRLLAAPARPLAAVHGVLLGGPPDGVDAVLLVQCGSGGRGAVVAVEQAQEEVLLQAGVPLRWLLATVCNQTEMSLHALLKNQRKVKISTVVRCLNILAMG